MVEVEERFGKPLPDVLVEQYNTLQSSYKVAEALGVSQGTVAGWLIRFRLKIVQTLVPERPTVADEQSPENQAALDEFFAQLAQVESEVSA